LLFSKLFKCLSLKFNNSEILADKKNILPLLLILKDHSVLKFNVLSDICSIDIPGKKYRFTIFYNLVSFSNNTRVFVICQTKEGSPLESLVNLFSSSSWSERECWDLHGIYFINHNNFVRILTDYGFKGHPLRKDFPLTGFVELFYDDYNIGVKYEPVELAQEYRNFQFKSPWVNDVFDSK
jgi:NADH-quinone oxidoreductase subunit C